MAFAYGLYPSFGFLEDLAAEIDKEVGKFVNNPRIYVFIGYFGHLYVGASGWLSR